MVRSARVITSIYKENTWSWSDFSLPIIYL